MDSNCHSTILNYEQSDKETIEWENFFAANDLSIINDPNAITFDGHRGSSRIDWTVTTPSIRQKCSHWTTNPDLDLLSDHIPIVITLNLTIPKKKPEPRRMWKLTKWKDLNNGIEEELKRLVWDQDNTEKMTNDLMHIFNKNIDKHVPLSTPKIKSYEWWTPEVERKRTIYRSKKRNLRRHTLDDLRKAKREYEAEIITAKENSWKKFVTATKPGGDAFLIYKILKKDKNAKLETRILDKNGSLSKDDEAKAEILMDTLTKELKISNEYQRQTELKAKSIAALPAADNNEPEINETEIAMVIKDLVLGKAPGPDNIPPVFYKNTFPTISKQLNLLFNKILSTGEIPTCFKRGKVIFIKKTRKGRQCCKPLPPNYPTQRDGENSGESNL